MLAPGRECWDEIPFYEAGNFGLWHKNPSAKTHHGDSALSYPGPYSYGL